MATYDRPRRARRTNIIETLEKFQTLGSDIYESDNENDIEFPSYILEVESDGDRSPTTSRSRS